jgi:hypothetical protein
MVLKSMRTSWTEHVARMGEMAYAFEIVSENLKVRDHFGSPSVRRIIVKCILK